MVFMEVALYCTVDMGDGDDHANRLGCRAAVMNSVVGMALGAARQRR